MIGTRSMMEMVACSLSSVMRVGLEIWRARSPSARARSTPSILMGLSTRLVPPAASMPGLLEATDAGRPKTELRSRAMLRVLSLPAPSDFDQLMPVPSPTLLLMRRILVSTMIWPLAWSMPRRNSRACSMRWAESMMMIVLVLGSKLTTPVAGLSMGLINPRISLMSVGRRYRSW